MSVQPIHPPSHVNPSIAQHVTGMLNNANVIDRCGGGGCPIIRVFVPTSWPSLRATRKHT